jgi:hypothetical protein
MSLFIVRIQDKPDGGVHRKVIGSERYGDGQQAIAGVEKILRTYAKHGYDDHQGYWWARDKDDQEYRFVVEGVPEGHS